MAFEAPSSPARERRDLGSTDALNLGRNLNSGSQFWPGRLDQFRVFKRLLTGAEIAALAAEL